MLTAMNRYIKINSGFFQFILMLWYNDIVSLLYGDVFF
jgi:hypothetical protein